MAGGAPNLLGEADLAAIIEMIEPWNKAVVDRNYEALMELCSDDVVFQPPGESAKLGNDFREWFEAFPTIRSMSWEVTHAEGEGNLAVIMGPVEEVIEQDGEIINFRGKFCDALRKCDDGKWRVASVTWNSNEP